MYRNTSEKSITALKHPRQCCRVRGSDPVLVAAQHWVWRDTSRSDRIRRLARLVATPVLRLPTLLWNLG